MQEQVGAYRGATGVARRAFPRQDEALTRAQEGSKVCAARFSSPLSS
jgi:hypothetical protein